ncbi:hypothetical protein CPC08DRAFT_197915 [Agrocybe pediades]|nr:hypothetical protein CPC08DRAFT_197915 [Agrocybe pediades]
MTTTISFLTKMPRPANAHDDSEPEGIEDEYLLDLYKAIKCSDKSNDLLDPILKAARGISLVIHPYAKLMPVIAAGVPAIKSVLGDDSDGEETDSEIDHAEEIRIYRGLCKLIPYFEDIVTACSKNLHVLRTFVKMLEDASHNGRSIDVYNISHGIVEWIKRDGRIEYDTEMYRMPKANEMTMRAWLHPEYAILVYPLSGQKDLICEEIHDKLYDLANGETDVSESEWPYYLYAPGTVFNLHDDLAGLFRGYLLPIVYRYIFTSPSTAVPAGPRRNTKSKKNKATLYGLTEVTARSIAYVCTITRIALRGLGWQLEDGAFEYEVFYQNIVTLLEGTEFQTLSAEEIEDWRTWRDELFEWFNGEINLPQPPGKKKTKKRKLVSIIEGRIIDPIKRHKAQQEARRQNENIPLDPIILQASEAGPASNSMATGTAPSSATTSTSTAPEWPPARPRREHPVPLPAATSPPQAPVASHPHGPHVNIYGPMSAEHDGAPPADVEMAVHPVPAVVDTAAAESATSAPVPSSSNVIKTAATNEVQHAIKAPAPRLNSGSDLGDLSDLSDSDTGDLPIQSAAKGKAKALAKKKAQAQAKRGRTSTRSSTRKQ